MTHALHTSSLEYEGQVHYLVTRLVLSSKQMENLHHAGDTAEFMEMDLLGEDYD